MYRAIENNQADHDFLCDEIANDPVLRALWTPKSFRPQSRASTEEFFHTLRRRPLSVYICLPDINSDSTEVPKPIGFISLRTEGAEHAQHRSAMLGLSIIGAHQGNGYGPEAINWVLDWAFKFGSLHRVSLHCHSFNHRGVKLYERWGFTKEGVLRECLWFNRAWHAILVFAMLESEWEALQPGGDQAAKTGIV